MDADAIRPLVDGFVDAFNRRDADAFVALMDPEVAFHPTVLVGDRGVYGGQVMLGDQVITPSAMAARLSATGLIVEAHAYLSDEQMLEHIGITLPPATRAALAAGAQRARS